ncbi:MAG: hypothetical protein K2X81_15745 [Candidatus Obscuribacterales bacterium]|nr:hypothetical protein [Candidatus Obscuribacterales bacterium]
MAIDGMNQDHGQKSARLEADLSATANNALEQHIAADCWSRNSASCADNNKMTVASNDSDWMQQRVEHRREDMAKQYGLDPAKANFDDIIKARAEQGTKDNVGRVERLRREEASAYHLDPEKATWEQIDIARVDARKKELGKE